MAKLPMEACILCIYQLCVLKCSPMRASVVALLPATNSPDHGSVPGAARSLATVTIPGIFLRTFKCRFVPRPAHNSAIHN